MKYELVLTGKFKRGLRLAKKWGLNISLLEDIVKKLLHKIPLKEKIETMLLVEGNPAISGFPFLMLLSGLDSKKYQSILHFKRTLIDNPQWGTSTIIPEKISDDNRKIDEYGEIAVRKLQAVPIIFTQKQLCTIANLYHSGESPNKIATKFNCCESTIRKALKNQNIEIVRCRAQAKVDTETAVKMYEEGHSLTEVGMRFGVSRKTITQVLQNNGIEICKRGDHTYTE